MVNYVVPKFLLQLWIVEQTKPSCLEEIEFIPDFDLENQSCESVTTHVARKDILLAKAVNFCNKSYDIQ